MFQPFRYARTAVMWPEFADAFVGADQVMLTDVCGFHESPIPGVTGELLVHAVLDAHPDQRRRVHPAPQRARRRSSRGSRDPAT